jgi:hypothetical protein
MAKAAVVEHRWGKRVQVAIPVRLDAPPSVAGVGIISNLSTSGAWIRTNLKLPALTRALVAFDSTQRHGHVAVPAYVIRQDLDGMGFEWCEMALPCGSEFLFAAEDRFSFSTPSALKRRARAESAEIGLSQ